MTHLVKNEVTSETADVRPVPVGRLATLSYGVGHMLNDITAAYWFTYLLLFLTTIGLSPRDAAIVMLSGQVADAFATVFVGDWIDQFGHFKLWHLGGSVLVALSFSFVFGGCIPCTILGTDSPTVETIGYSTFAAIFNVGWAVTQVSHMSMVNCITPNPISRVALTSCRNAFTMVANLSLYAIAFIVFSIANSNLPVDIKSQYRRIAYVSIFIGCCFVGFFLVGTKEPRMKQQVDCEPACRISWTHWFKKALYYQVALVYMLTRLVTNVSQSLLAFYVINDLGMGQSSKALVPAVIFISSFMVSVILQEIRWSSWRLKVFFSIGAILWMFSGAGIVALPSRMSYLMYILSIIIGASNTLMTVTSISMQSVLVGDDLNGCGFVYGSLSFLDKLSCGIALYIIESFEVLNFVMKLGFGLFGCSCSVFSLLVAVTGGLKDSSTTSATLGSSGGYSITRLGIGIVPAVSALLSLIVTCTMKFPSTRWRIIEEPLLA